MEENQKKKSIEEGKIFLGIEFGSTRIKAILIDETHNPIASGSHDWENRLENQIWTYHEEDIWNGIRMCYQSLVQNVKDQYGVRIQKLAGFGVSAMMHGYIALDTKGEWLVPFRTWRNTMTEDASMKLTEAFRFHIPQRWSIAHLYQAILNQEEHVGHIDYLTTLAGYVHWKLCGEKVLGIGEASGMFPIDGATRNYNKRMMDTFQEIIASNNYQWALKDILPKVLVAGENAGTMTKEGVQLLDVSGELEAGTPMCPPEGDAGTGMTATNSVAVRTGNVSAGTSVFAMVVLENDLHKVYDEIDLVTTPSGHAVGMVHCNNCTSDLNAWVNLFDEFVQLIGCQIDKGELYRILFEKALEAESDGGGMLSYNYFSGEHITGFEEGRPLFVRTPESHMNLANFMRVHLFTALGALKTGLDILLQKEKVKLDYVYGHGGFFKTPVVGQRIMAAAMDTPVSVLETAGEGGAWGIALLAAYRVQKKEGETLEDYLNAYVFANQRGTTIEPVREDVEGFNHFLSSYTKGLAIERAAVEHL